MQKQAANGLKPKTQKGKAKIANPHYLAKSGLAILQGRMRVKSASSAELPMRCHSPHTADVTLPTK